MKEQLDGWRAKIVSFIEEEKPLRERVEAFAPAVLPVGLGAYSGAVLEYEMRVGPDSRMRERWPATPGYVLGSISVMVGAKRARSTAVVMRRYAGCLWKRSGDSEYD